MSPDWAVDHGHLCVWKLESVDFRCLSRGIENKQGILRTSGQASPSRPLREGGEMLAWSVGAAPWGGETYQLVGRQGKDTEHEMAGDLGMSAYPDMAPAELVLEAGVGPLDTGLRIRKRTLLGWTWPATRRAMVFLQGFGVISLRGRTRGGRMACAPGRGFAGSGRCARPPDPLAVGLHRLPDAAGSALQGSARPGIRSARAVLSSG